MNSKDYRNIREAYLQVYAPQELTEEQVWEEVEYWVNSLLEEGYDLSDYTWEEMYESYLSESLTATPDINARRTQRLNAIGNFTKSAVGGAYNYLTKDTPRAPYSAPNPNTMDGRYQDPKTQKKILNSVEKPVKPVKPVPPVEKTVPPTATSTGPKSTPTTPTTPTKPVASTAPTAPTKPAIGTTPGGTKFERRTPTSAELSAAQASRASGGSEEDAIKAGVGASKPATPAPNPVKANVPGLALGGKDPRASTPTPAATPTDSGESDKLKIKKSDVTSGFDMFDVVKGYLIGEGYADTEEAALAIMANMSEDWKYSIMEQQISSVSANAPSGVKKPTVTASISAGGKTPPGQKMLDKAGQMLSGKGPSNNFGRGF